MYTASHRITFCQFCFVIKVTIRLKKKTEIAQGILPVCNQYHVRVYATGYRYTRDRCSIGMIAASARLVQC